MTSFAPLRWLACLVTFAFTATSVAAAPRCPDRPIKLAFLETPTLYTDGKGLDRDIVDELAARSGCRFDAEAMPRARTWHEMEYGRLDMTTAVLPTPDRERTMWIINYLQLRNYVLVAKPVAERLRSLQDFLAAPKDVRLGIVRGYKHGDVLDSWINDLARQDRVDDVVETELLYKMLQAKRLTAIIGSPLIYPQKLREYGLTEQMVIYDWGGSSAASPRGLGLSRRSFSESEAREWQGLIDGMQRDGTLRRLIAKYLGKRETEAVLLN